MSRWELLERVKREVDLEEVFGRNGYHVGQDKKAKCPFHGSITRKVSVDKRRGMFKCWVCEETGTVIDFYLKYFAAEVAVKASENGKDGSQKEKIKAAVKMIAADYLGVRDGASGGREKRKGEVVVRVDSAEEARQAKWKREKAQFIYKTSDSFYLADKKEKVSADTVWQYLSSRGIRLTDFEVSVIAENVRYKRQTQYSKEHGLFEAIVLGCFKVIDGKVGVSGIQQIFLKDGRKVDLGVDSDGVAYPPKKMLGQVGGSFCPVWRGVKNGKVQLPLSERSGVEIIITEGFEDALSIGMVDKERPVLCANSLSNLSTMILPVSWGVSSVVIYGDVPKLKLSKKAYDAQLRIIQKAIRNFSSQGKKVYYAEPSSGYDANEALNVNTKLEAV